MVRSRLAGEYIESGLKQAAPPFPLEGPRFSVRSASVHNSEQPMEI